MAPLHFFSICTAAAGLGLFALLSAVTFVTDNITWRSWACAATFAAASAASLSALCWSPAQQTLRLALGVALMWLSVGLFVSAVVASHRRPLTAMFSDDLPCWVIMDGIYRYVRHPFYSAYMAAFVGMAIASCHAAAAASALAVAVAYTRAALAEEQKFARCACAETYRHYSLMTGRFVPRLSALALGKGTLLTRNRS